MSNSRIGFWRPLLCTGLALIGAGTSSADVMYDEPLAKEFAISDLVVEAKIVGVAGQCTQQKCENSSYEISASTVIYESMTTNRSMSALETTICAQSGLGLGETYVLLLRRVKDKGVDDPSTPVDESAGQCTFFANFGAVFLKYTADSYFRYGSPEASTLVTEGAVQYLTIGKRQDGLIDELNRLARKRKK